MNDAILLKVAYTKKIHMMKVFKAFFFFFMVDRIMLKVTSTVKDHTRALFKLTPLDMNNSILP